jgi:hypothetical protein
MKWRGEFNNLYDVSLLVIERATSFELFKTWPLWPANYGPSRPGEHRSGWSITLFIFHTKSRKCAPPYEPILRTYQKHKET